MADGIFERGEVYWVRMDTGFGAETGVGRPGVIVSSNEVNRAMNCVTIAFMTTKEHYGNWRVTTEATGRTSYVLCNQIQTVDKSRLGKCIGMFDAPELRDLDYALEEVLGLGYVDDLALKEKDREIEARDAVIAEKDAEIAALKNQLEANMLSQRNRDESYRIEMDMWQRLYEKALAQVVDMKYTNDLFLKNHLGREQPKTVEAKAVEAPSPAEPKPPVEPEMVIDERVDINRCTITALKKLGFSLAVAKKIVGGRPYNAVSDLKNGFGIKATHYRIMEPKLKCTPVIKSALAEPDPGYEVEEPVAETKVVAAPAKVNINTASAGEIHVATGLNMTVCYSITGCRKRDGLYKSVNDLLNIPKFTAHHMKKYGHLLEV